MRAFLSGLLVAAVIAVCAALVLNDGVQRSSGESYRTEGVRP